jgi:adenylate cyclase
LITDSLYQLVQDQVEVIQVGSHLLKGRKGSQVTLYSLISLKGEDQSPYHQIHKKLRHSDVEGWKGEGVEG